jgi:hypothetical protein
MAFMRKFTFVLVCVALFLGAVYVFTNYYSYIFATTVEGQVLGVDRVTQPTMIMGQAAVNANNVLYSFAVAVRTKDGEIFSGSSEDRQWAIVQTGHCVTAKFYPYAPWDLDKGGTYFNVRMQKLHDCPPGMPRLPEKQAEPAPPIPTEIQPASPPPQGVIE